MALSLPLFAPKPPKGAACNGCGLCCLAEQCRASLEQFGQQERCPALEIGQGRYWCGLMRRPSAYDAIPEGYERLAEIGADVEATARGFWISYIGGDRGCDSEGE